MSSIEKQKFEANIFLRQKIREAVDNAIDDFVANFPFVEYAPKPCPPCPETEPCEPCDEYLGDWFTITGSELRGRKQLNLVFDLEDAQGRKIELIFLWSINGNLLKNNQWRLMLARFCERLGVHGFTDTEQLHGKSLRLNPPRDIRTTPRTPASLQELALAIGVSSDELKAARS